MTPTRDTAGVRVGVIGAGAIAPTHCEGILLHEDATILAIADTHEGRGWRFSSATIFASATRVLRIC